MVTAQTNKLVLVHGKDLKELAHSSPEAETALYALALRERLRTFTDITRLRYELMKKGHKIVESRFLKVFTDLESKGMGSIIHGRGDKPTRFEWNYSMKSIAEAALEGKDVQVEPLKPDNTVLFPAIEAKTKKPRKKRTFKTKVVLNTKDVKHVFIPFRNELLEFKFPLDTTEAEIKSIVGSFKFVS